MAKLALAVGEEKRLGQDTASFRITTRSAQLAHRAFGQSIVVYRQSRDALMFIGTGLVLGLDFEAAGFELVRLGSFRSFSVPSLDAAETRDPGVRRGLSLDDNRFDEILQQALATDVSAQALAEAQGVFAHDREEALQAYQRVHDRVLQRWNHRCVVTGAQFAPSSTRPHPDLRVVAIRPREFGGPLHVRNYLPMVSEAEHAWVRGHITLGPSFGFQLSARLIDPEFSEQLLPLGRLNLPENPSLWPDLDLIAYHRAHIFDRD